MALTELVFILDKSGSMAGLEDDTIGGYNALLAQQREQHGWEFIFLGANMDAIAAAAQCGIGAERAQRFHADGPGLTLSFAALNETVAAYRASGPGGK